MWRSSFAKAMEDRVEFNREVSELYERGKSPLTRIIVGN